MGLKETILASQDIDREAFPAPKWGLPDGLYVRGLTAMEHVNLTAEKVQKERSFSARMVAMALVDKDGAQVFAANEWQEVAKKDMATVEAAAEVCMRLSGMGVKEQDELKKTYDETPMKDSPTDSRFLSDA